MTTPATHSKSPSPKHLAIVGATGAVGIEMLRVLERRNFPIASLRLLASPRSTGKKLTFRDVELTVEPLTEQSFEGIDIALFSAGGGISKEFAPHAVKAGAIVVDNSSAFRMDPKVPLVVPEINAADVAAHSGIIANPNCTTAITLMAVHPLHQAFGLKRIIASSYQAVSGTGARAIEELRDQVAAINAGQPVVKEVYPHQIAFNVLPHVDSFLEDGYTREEMKMQYEGQRILHLSSLTASVTCVRVPVYRAHSVAVTAEFDQPVSIEKARAAIQAAPGIQLVDDPATATYPMPIDCTGEDDCRVGRLRLDCALPNALTFWVSGDQLLKGAALNAVQIAELLYDSVIMPNYDYECSKCRKTFEVFQSMNDKTFTVCPKEKCRMRSWGKGSVKRLLGGGAGLIFKGSGFYTTDYRSEGYKSAAKKDASAPAKAEGGKSGSSESPKSTAKNTP